MAYVQQVATVEVKPAVQSKVNWIAGLGALAAVIGEVLPYLPPKQQVWANIAVIILTGAATIYARTYQTTTITPSAAAKV